ESPYTSRAPPTKRRPGVRSWNLHHPPPAPDVCDIGERLIRARAGHAGEARRDLEPQRCLVASPLRRQDISEPGVIARCTQIVAIERPAPLRRPCRAQAGLVESARAYGEARVERR